MQELLTDIATIPDIVAAARAKVSDQDNKERRLAPSDLDSITRPHHRTQTRTARHVVADFGKPAFESKFTETVFTIVDIDHTLPPTSIRG